MGLQAFFFKNEWETHRKNDTLIKNRGGGIMLLQWKKEHKDQAIRDIQQFFYDERGEEIGEIAAENVLDFFSAQLGQHFYNQGIKDSLNVVRDRLGAVEDDLYALERK